MNLETFNAMRGGISLAYRERVMQVLGYKIPAVDSGDQLLELAKRLDASQLESTYGWRTEPPFPGYADTPEELPTGWRMTCATNIFVGDDHAGVIFMTLFSGRPVAVVMNRADYPIPSTFKAVR